MEKWRSAKTTLKIIALVGVPWCLAWAAAGSRYLFTSGPGLPLIMVGLIGLAPGMFIFLRNGNEDGTRPPR